MCVCVCVLRTFLGFYNCLLWILGWGFSFGGRGYAYVVFLDIFVFLLLRTVVLEMPCFWNSLFLKTKSCR